MRSAHSGERYRRSPALVFSWAADPPLCLDLVSATRTAVPVAVIDILSRLSQWTTADQLKASHPELGPRTDVEALLEELAQQGLVERKSSSASRWVWKEWSPEAAFFHFGTRDRTYRDDHVSYDIELREKARRHPPPVPTKTIAGRRIDLPPARLRGSLPHALSARRTWRQFASTAVGLEKVSSLLQLTFGVQKRASVEGQGPVVLKTSPSGGARHAIEAYVLATNSTGLAKAAYHYDANTHQLVDLERTFDGDALLHALGNQYWFMRAGAFVVMTAIFERAMWRYPFNRAYRSILAEAGHLGQTFCLVATALNLAPFCTMAFRDREIEEMIGVDGVSESAMYVVGVGTRPRRTVGNPGKILTTG